MRTMKMIYFAIYVLWLLVSGRFNNWLISRRRQLERVDFLKRAAK